MPVPSAATQYGGRRRGSAPAARVAKREPKVQIKPSRRMMGVVKFDRIMFRSYGIVMTGRALQAKRCKPSVASRAMKMPTSVIAAASWRDGSYGGPSLS
jgi:hypothetical protein